MDGDNINWRSAGAALAHLGCVWRASVHPNGLWGGTESCKGDCGKCIGWLGEHLSREFGG